ncbi:MAG: septal ring lytic transglycosylase RlpA family protein [Xanthomonadaceae bacterium]|nr:septal ring lytic transglycosylase RlpA family protein [Xanthomonadaceae bacterium]
MKPQLALGLVLPLLLAACATTGTASKPAPAAHPLPAQVHASAHPPRVSPYAPAQEDPGKRGDYVAGGLFRPGVPDAVPADIPDVDAIPEPAVRDEPRARTGNRDYVVLGKRYQVLDDHNGFVEEGMASYYGSKFHGRRTSSQEVYDMYAFTAAHKTLPLPSFARVTNLDNGKSVIVRVNDRGPFHPGRVIDLSYAAAVKLGYRNKGSARVRVEALQPEDGGATAAAPASAPATTGLDRWAAAAPAVQVPTAQVSEPGQVTLQVASFSDAQNARHALGLLQSAAIASAQLQDTEIGGKKIWRLRIGPVSEAATSELAARVVGLGFGQPQRVRN